MNTIEQGIAVSASARKPTPWRGPLTCIWLGIIAFSSTSFAGHWADSFFARTAARIPMLHFRSLDPYRRWLLHFLAEKDVHLFLYAVLAALLYWWTGFRKPRPALVLGIGTLVGVTSELLQLCFPGRDPSLRDVGINVAGTCLGFFLCWVITGAKRHIPLEVPPEVPSVEAIR